MALRVNQKLKNKEKLRPETGRHLQRTLYRPIGFCIFRCTLKKMWICVHQKRFNARVIRFIYNYVESSPYAPVLMGVKIKHPTLLPNNMQEVHTFGQRESIRKVS